MKHCLLRTQEEMTLQKLMAVFFLFFLLFCSSPFCWLFVINFTSDNDNESHLIGRCIMAKADL